MATTGPGSGLAAPDPVAYARGHDLFEARSDQRSQIIGWLGDRLDRRADAARLDVLSVGCGDGTVDAALARRSCALAPPGARRSWTGLDPHPASVAAFREALEALDAPGLDIGCEVSTFADLRAGARFDVVTCVHSLYYVQDLASSLRHALDLLRPGGELLVLHAPLGTLNGFAAELAPLVAGGPQPWSEDVAAELARLPVSVACTELHASVDLTDAGSADPALLDFTVQAVLPPRQRAAVIEKLDAHRLPGPGRRLAHPVTGFVVRPGPGDGAPGQPASESPSITTTA